MIDVPVDASAGERYAVVWAEVSAPASAAGGVTLVNRVGVRVYLSVAPGGAVAGGAATPAVANDRRAPLGLLYFASALLALLAGVSALLVVRRRRSPPRGSGRDPVAGISGGKP